MTDPREAFERLINDESGHARGYIPGGLIGLVLLIIILVIIF